MHLLTQNSFCSGNHFENAILSFASKMGPFFTISFFFFFIFFSIFCVCVIVYTFFDIFPWLSSSHMYCTGIGVNFRARFYYFDYSIRVASIWLVLPLLVLLWFAVFCFVFFFSHSNICFIPYFDLLRMYCWSRRKTMDSSINAIRNLIRWNYNLLLSIQFDLIHLEIARKVFHIWQCAESFLAKCRKTKKKKILSILLLLLLCCNLAI